MIGLSEGETPKFRRLIQEAGMCYALARISLQKCGATGPSLSAFCRFVRVSRSTVGNHLGRPSGLWFPVHLERCFRGAFKLLVDSWPAIKQQFPAR